MPAEDSVLGIILAFPGIIVGGQLLYVLSIDTTSES